MSDICPKAHVVLLSSPGIGHLSPILGLAKRLALDHNLTATIITFFDLAQDIQQSMLSSIPIGVSTVCLPPISLDDLPNNTHIITRLSIMISRSIPFLRKILLELHIKTTHIAAYIIDLFGGDTICLARELGIPSYIFFTTNFFYLSFLLNLPTLYDEQHDKNPNWMLSLPGCTPLHSNDFPQSAIDKKSDVFAWMIHHSKHHDKVDGIMVNSFEVMERGVVRFFKEGRNGKSPILPIGPITCVNWSENSQDDFKSCLQWLDQQPVQSVLFIAFGSGGTLSFEQTKEMAFGLELSGQRFLWVVRTPVDADRSAAYFKNRQGRNKCLAFLPHGFVEKTKEKGMLVDSWGPQAKILAHCATGGFLSHCGWNSTLESITNGVPMIAWPLYSEQSMNAVLLVEGAKVALRPAKMRTDGVVRKEEIADVVKDLMEGERGKNVRRRMYDLQVAAQNAVRNEGSSTKSLAQMVNNWRMLAHNQNGKIISMSDDFLK